MAVKVKYKRWKSMDASGFCRRLKKDGNPSMVTFFLNNQGVTKSWNINMKAIQIVL